MKGFLSDPRISIHGFESGKLDWKLWRALWELRWHQLAEEGVLLPFEEITTGPEDVGRDEYEWDYHHIGEVYLQGSGGFWIAWWGDTPAGHIGAQDLGDFIELRRMYVRQEFRRHGIATCLVQTLLNHCHKQSVKAIELWTGLDGKGHFLYQKMGFHVTQTPGMPREDLDYQLNFVPGEDEIRMRYVFHSARRE